MTAHPATEILDATERRRAAYHEAGHAVAHHVLGWTLGPVSIRSHGSGLCRARGAPLELTPRLRAAAAAVGLLAGMAAEMRADPELSSSDASRFASHIAQWWSGDSVQLLTLGRLVTSGADAALEAWGDRRADEARALVDRHWQAVEQLAEALLRRRRLSGAAAAAGISRATQVPA